MGQERLLPPPHESVTQVEGCIFLTLEPLLLRFWRGVSPFGLQVRFIVWLFKACLREGACPLLFIRDLRGTSAFGQYLYLGVEPPLEHLDFRLLVFTTTCFVMAGCHNWEIFTFMALSLLNIAASNRPLSIFFEDRVIYICTVRDKLEQRLFNLQFRFLILL